MSASAEIQAVIAGIQSNGGVLKADICLKLCQKLDMTIESLMIELLPLAEKYSVAPISSYFVGAVVKGQVDKSTGAAALYLGANLEFSDQALCHTVHAEQAAISNAWQSGEQAITAIAITAAPCGHCRQFIYEAVGDKPFPILIPRVLTPREKQEASEKEYSVTDFSELLPSAFGPKDLGCEHLLMDKDPSVQVETHSDKLLEVAINAAKSSHAPYSKNLAACVLELKSGEMLTGGYAENAAYNPSLVAIAAVLSKLMLMGFDNPAQYIKRLLLVENPTISSQKEVSKLIASRFANQVKFEYVSLASL